ncbi:MAG: iron transporter [Actinobacteria bacterium]|nr:iron transporter [Actinomycetota bacterium]
MLSNAIIGLREGLEAALVVGILLAYLTKTGRAQLKRSVWTGVGAAIGLSVAVGAVLQQVSEDLSERSAEIFAGAMSLVAVGLVTWMIFWMRRTARNLRGELQGKLDTAAALGTGSVAALAFVAVAREGVETALFLWTSVSAGQSAVAGTVGALLGLAVAVLLGRLIMLGAIKLNLSTFFRISGAALIVVAGAVLSYAIHEFQEVGFLPGDDATAISLSSAFAKDTPLGLINSVLLGFSNKASWLQVFAWAAYVAVVMTVFLRPGSTPAKATDATDATDATQSPAVDATGENSDSAAQSSTAETEKVSAASAASR